MDMIQKTAIVIPAYKPDDRLPPYAEALRQAGAARIVVVDDGSGEEFLPVFERTEAIDIVHVIHYSPNRGKGEALRTGLRYVQEECPECELVVTADADGQHRVEDVLRMISAQAEYGDGVLLGSRDFTRPDVPPRSRFGNRTTTVVFRLFYGQWVTDTQTGLRAFGRDLIPMMLDVEGDRYEYEMNVLIACANHKVTMRPLTIETVYENNNETSHFRPIQDSARIYKVILGGFVKFIAASLISFCVDYLMFLLLNQLLKPAIPDEQAVNFWIIHFMLRVGLATFGARVISSIVNYNLNHKLVFTHKNEESRSTVRFYAVVLLNLVLSAALVSTLHMGLGVSENIVKMPVDILLFFVSYSLQKNWVFREKKVQSSVKGSN